MQGRDDIARIASARAVEIASRAISLASSVKGEKGDKGDPGEIVLKNVPVPGEKGEQGEKGERGYTGAQGPKGDKGDKGDRGTDAVGAKGDKGDKGDTGPQGERGFTGPRGLKGDEGERGLTGPIPKHEIKGLKFRFQQDDGDWGKWIIVPTGGGGGGRDDKLFDRQAELVTIADAYKNNTNPFPSSSSFATDITVNGITVGRGDGNVSTNTALGVDALGSPLLVSSNINNVGIGDNTLNDITANPGDLGVSFSGSGYSPTESAQTIQLQYFSGTPVIAGGTYPLINIYINASGQLEGDVATINAGSGFTDTSTVMTFTGLGGSGALFTYSALNSAKNNTVVGYNAGSATTTGENNTAIGYNAGSLTVNGKNNIYIGSGVTGSAVYRENEIIIGANATGGGNNTTTIGSVDTTEAYIQGTVYTSNGLNVAGSVNLATGPFNFVDIGTGNMSGYTHNYSTGTASSPSAINIGTGTSTGAIRTITTGATLGPSTITIGPTNDTNIINIGNGATQSGLTKSINIGSNSVAGSTTTLNLGSTSGTSTTNLRSAVTFAATTQNINAVTLTTGTLSLGGTTQTGAITLGQSTAAQTVNIAYGTNTATKTINIGRSVTSTTGATVVNIGPPNGSTGSSTINIENQSRPSGSRTINIGTGTISGSATSTITIGALAGAFSTTNLVGYTTITSIQPASATATGTAGTITWDNNYIYICVATDTWKRMLITTW